MQESDLAQLEVRARYIVVVQKSLQACENIFQGIIDGQGKFLLGELACRVSCRLFAIYVPDVCSLQQTYSDQCEGRFLACFTRGSAVSSANMSGSMN